jgi:small conductance mechanosensitive channel
MGNLMEGMTERLQELAQVYGLKVLAALAIFIIGRIVVSIAISFIKKLMRRSGTDETLIKFLGSLIKFALLAMVIIASLGALGIQTTSFIAILGAAGLAVGLAMQGSLSNFASGVLLIIFRPFKVGDFIDAGGSMGSVQEVSVFTTTLTSPDNRRIIIPNGAITSSNITNFSAEDTRRVDMVFGIGYGDDIKKTKETLEQLIKADSRILADPAPVVAVSELADSSVNLVVRPWVKKEDYWGVFFDFHEQVKLTFDAQGISIPFPQTDVHLFKEAG